MTIPTLTGAEERPPEPAAPGPQPAAARANLYVARMLQQHLVDDPIGKKLGERRQRGAGRHFRVHQAVRSTRAQGPRRRRADHRRDRRTFSSRCSPSPTTAAAACSSSAATRCCCGSTARVTPRAPAAPRVLMRDVLREVGRIELPDAQVTLQMSQGVHSGTLPFFRRGQRRTSRFFRSGPAWTRMVAMQHGAERRTKSSSARKRPQRVAAGLCSGSAKGRGLLLQREPPGYGEKMPRKPAPPMSRGDARALPVAGDTRARAGRRRHSEHRPVTIAFIRFEGTDALIERARPGGRRRRAASARSASSRPPATEQDVAFLASDVDADGGKLILTGGAPKVTGNDEERMLLALRKIVASELPIADPHRRASRRRVRRRHRSRAIAARIR